MAIAIFLCGCNDAKLVTSNELMKKTKVWKEPKVAIWYYVGSDEKFNYFYFTDLGVNETYKVLKDQMNIGYNFPLTKNQKEWKVMPWGPIAVKQKK